MYCEVVSGTVLPSASNVKFRRRGRTAFKHWGTPVTKRAIPPSPAANCWAAERQETERAQRQTKKQEPEEDMELRGDKNPDVVEEGAGSKKRNLERSSDRRRMIEDFHLP